MTNTWNPRTLAVHAGTRRSQYSETNEAIFLTQGFVYPDAETAKRRFTGDEDGFIYARYGNPTVASFEQRLARENGWRAEFAAHVIEEYKRFCFLAVTGTEAFTPSDQVDQAWLLHLTYSRDYWERFCPEVIGKPLHHGPTKGGEAEQVDAGGGEFLDGREQDALRGSFEKISDEGDDGAGWIFDEIGGEARLIEMN